MAVTSWGPGGHHRHQEESKHMNEVQETDIPIWVSPTDRQHWKALRAPLSLGGERFLLDLWSVETREKKVMLLRFVLGGRGAPEATPCLI